MPYLLPTIHPAGALRSGRQITDVIANDLGKAKRISETGPQLEENIIWILPGNPAGIERTFHAGLQWLRHWRRVGAEVAIDIETSALDYWSCHLYSIAIAEAHSGVAVTFTLRDFHTLPSSYEAALVQALVELLADPGVTKVYHNAPFDAAVLHWKGFKISGRLLDTQGMHHLIQPDIPHHLGWVGHTYLDVGPWKLDHSSGKMANTKDPIQLLVYNGRDALYTAMLVNPMREAIHSRGMSDTLISWQAAFAQLAIDMEIAGLPINFDRRRQMAAEMRKQMDKDLHWLREFLSWPDFNPMSDNHKREVLFGDKYAAAPWNLGLTASKRTKETSMPSTSYKSVIDSFEHPFVRTLANYVETRQTYATQYRDGTLRGPNGKVEKPGAYQRAIGPDNRMHARWKPNTLASSRFGSEPNAQNQRLKDREFFQPPDGRVFIGADKDQLELRIAACRAGVRELLEEMAKPDGDPHTLAARNVFNDFDTRAEKERKLLRNMTKNTVYASLYLAGVQTVWRTIRERKQLDPIIRAKMTLPVVRHIHSSYFGRYIEFPRWHERDLKQIARDGYIEIPPLGRRRYCPLQPAPATEFSNWKVQCYTGDMRIHTVDGLPEIIEADKTHVVVPGRNGVLAQAALVPRGEAAVRKIYLSDRSRALTVSEDHEWLCQTADEYTYKRVNELRTGDLICTELPASSAVEPLVMKRDWPYWLGAFISDGATTNYQYDLFFGTAKNRRSERIPKEYWSFARQRGWCPRRPEDVKRNLVKVKAGDTAAGRLAFLEDMQHWGYNVGLSCKHKRVPRAIYTAGRWGIKQFIWGMLEADGTISSSPPGPARNHRHRIYNFHMANLPLLQDLQLLCTYLGIESRIIGPLQPNSGKPYVSWRLDVHAYDIETVIFGERSPSRQRARQSRGPLAPRSVCEEFLNTLPTNPYRAKSSEATLWQRIKAGGSTTAWTLRELYRKASAPVPPLYNAVPVLLATGQSENSKQPVYTLSVADPLHRYLCQGTVTKNCLGADIVTMEMCQIQDEIRRKFNDAWVVLHGHDQVVIECYEKDAEEVLKITNRIFGATPLDGPAGRVLLTAEGSVGKNLKEAK